jgi:protein TonB
VTGAAVDHSSDWRRPSPRRRAVAIGLTLAAELLFLLVLLGLNPTLPDKILPRSALQTFNLSPESPKPRQVSLKPKAKAQLAKLPKVTPPPKAAPLPPSPLIALSRADLAAADISNVGSHASGAASASAGSGAGPGEGPGGARLYKAEWYREPTQGEIAYYLPKTVDRGSWARIGCRTVAHYHVEDCYLIGESPMGSGLARAMRQASWQFLVRPPNVDGKPLIGSWVRIQFDFDKDGGD